jgi:hypothetical protein
MTTMTTRRQRIATAVAHVAAAAAMTVALAPTAGAADSYGAIAYSPNGSWGRSHAYPTKAAAEATAVKSCGSADCKVLTTFTACGAVAAKDHEFQGGIGPDLSAAMKDALSKLSGGYIDTWACN